MRGPFASPSARVLVAACALLGALAFAGCSREAPPATVASAPETFAATLARVQAVLPASGYVSNDYLPAAGAPVPAWTEKRRIRVGLPWLLNDEEAPWFVADAQGFFAAAGLEVELLPGGPGKNYLAQLAARTIDIGVINMSTHVAKFVASPTGADVVIVGAVLRRTPEVILALDAAVPSDQPSTRPLTARDLVGRRIGIETTSQYLVEAVFERAGLPKVSATLVRVTTVDALVHGRVQAVIAWIVNQPRLLEDAGYRNWHVLRLADLGWEDYADVSVVRPDLLDLDPQLVRRYLWALRQAVEFMLDHPAEAAAITRRRATDAALSETQIRRRFELQEPLIVAGDRPNLLRVDPAALDRTAAHLVRAGILVLPSAPRR